MLYYSCSMQYSYAAYRLSNPGRIAVTVKMLSERPAPQQARQRGCRSCPLRGRTRATEGIGKASPRGAPAAVLRRCLVAALDVSRRGLARRGGLSLTPYHLHLPAPRTVHQSGPEPESQLVPVCPRLLLPIVRSCNLSLTQLIFSPPLRRVGP
jgi:hypothetical protein